MSVLEDLTQSLRVGQKLSLENARLAATELTREAVHDDAKQEFLVTLHTSGETIEVITGFAEVFRSRAVDPGLGDVAQHAIDIVGTGGSRSRGYNISSATSIIVAACGQPVLKHGNRAVTSQSGAADFLGTVGVTVQSDPAVLRRCVEELNFCFFFAPAFHPAFKSLMSVRLKLAEAGQRTIFNILGPMINPAQPRFQLLGVFSQELVAPLAEVLSRVGVERGISAHCALSDGRVIDELTLAGRNHVVGIGEYSGLNGVWSAERLGLPSFEASSVTGGSAADNVAAFHSLLDGRGDPGLFETLVLNAGVALHVSQAVDSLEAGFTEARASLRDGRVKTWLEKARAFFENLR